MKTVKEDLLEIFAIISTLTLKSLFVMLLWNWLMPIIFGLITLTFWQSIGITLLFPMLFGKINPSAKEEFKKIFHMEKNIK